MDNTTLIEQLKQRFNQQTSVNFREQGQLVAIDVENASACASLFLQGAQISHYQPQQQTPVLWCSEHCDYSLGRSLRGGIPICWPWFGGLHANPKTITEQYSTRQLDDASAHGFVREQAWQLVSVEEGEDSTTLLLQLDIPRHSQPFWPFQTRLEYRVTIGQHLDIAFTVHNRCADKFHYSSALHSYFDISHIDNVQLQGLDGCHYRDALDHWSTQQQRGKLAFDGEVDRIYQRQPPRLTLHDTANSDLYIDSDNSHSTVVWNPWIEKAKRLSHFDDHAYQQMVCVETANAGLDFISLAPGESHTLDLRLSRATC
ncbi:glucose-6-phosphate 1-epimerase [Sinobacterium caligoides]|uniref:Putative glucose-6-phosphate 1-epimerase n=1 Tax=Sinobacterium caligoides TaxID=933926 RepID=A0A3N2DH61_9GAMM|nr:D-hexose-6-phosphate mutarotase [Sinobacterium caligoides]ROR98714.1 glucose-6-phosphate 1-epimerase [Sinobacterium caligoides]